MSWNEKLTIGITLGLVCVMFLSTMKILKQQKLILKSQTTLIDSQIRIIKLLKDKD